MIAKRLHHLHDQLATARHPRRAACVLPFAAGLQPRRRGVPATACVGPHVRRAAEAGDARVRRGRAVSLDVDLQRRADEQVAGVVPGRLAKRPIRAQRAVVAGEEDVGPCGDVALHAELRAEAVDRLDEARLDRVPQLRMRIERPVPAYVAAQPEAFAVRRQDQLDRRRIEPDAVVQARDAVFGVDALDGHHRHQDLDLRHVRRITREQRLDVEWRRTAHDVMHPVARYVDARQARDELVHLRDDDPVLERRRLDDDRRVFGIGTGVQVALRVSGIRGDQGHPRRQVDVVATEELEIRVDRADIDPARGDEPCEAHRLRSREGKIEPRGDALLEDIEMLRKRDNGLHEVQPMHGGWIERGQRRGEEVGLLLVVALEADAIAGCNDGAQQVAYRAGLDDLALQPIPEHPPGARHPGLELVELSGPTRAGRGHGNFKPGMSRATVVCVRPQYGNKYTRNRIHVCMMVDRGSVCKCKRGRIMC